MADATYQKIQMVGTSTKSLSDAISVAVAKAAEIIKDPDLVRSDRAARRHFQRQSAAVPGHHFGRRPDRSSAESPSHDTDSPVFSWPTVVAGPWPGSKIVSSGRREYLRADAGRQLVEIAVVKVRPADAALRK